MQKAIHFVLLHKIKVSRDVRASGVSCRNQRMSEDQSVLGRRRIYYETNGGEALICSDSEDEAIEDEEEKKEFKHSEDCIIRYGRLSYYYYFCIGVDVLMFKLCARCDVFLQNEGMQLHSPFFMV